MPTETADDESLIPLFPITPPPHHHTNHHTITPTITPATAACTKEQRKDKEGVVLPFHTVADFLRQCEENTRNKQGHVQRSARPSAVASTARRTEAQRREATGNEKSRQTAQMAAVQKPPETAPNAAKRRQPRCAPYGPHTAKTAAHTCILGLLLVKSANSTE